MKSIIGNSIFRMNALILVENGDLIEALNQYNGNHIVVLVNKIDIEFN